MWVRGKMENWRQSEEQTSVSAACKEEEQYGSVNQQHLKAPRAEAERSTTPTEEHPRIL